MDAHWLLRHLVGPVMEYMLTHVRIYWFTVERLIGAAHEEPVAFFKGHEENHLLWVIETV